jgi:far upstream element-binding protein
MPWYVRPTPVQPETDILQEEKNRSGGGGGGGGGGRRDEHQQSDRYSQPQQQYGQQGGYGQQQPQQQQFAPQGQVLSQGDPDPYAAYGGYQNYIALWYASMAQQGQQPPGQAPPG